MKHVMLYKIPPQRFSSGHEAGQWNVGQPMWQGKLKIFCRESKCLMLHFWILKKINCILKPCQYP
eukprot:UN21558